MNTLVIYESYPTSIDLFLIPDNVMDDKIKQTLKTCSGKFINETDLTADEQLALDQVLYWLLGVCDEESNPPTEEEIKYNELLAKYRLSDEERFNIQKPIEWVVTTGFVE